MPRLSNREERDDDLVDFKPAPIVHGTRRLVHPWNGYGSGWLLDLAKIVWSDISEENPSSDRLLFNSHLLAEPFLVFTSDT